VSDHKVPFVCVTFAAKIFIYEK